MKHIISIVDESGEAIELFKTDDSNLAEGAKLGAQALLDLFKDDMDLEDGYFISDGQQESEQSKKNGYQLDFDAQ